MSGCNKRLFLYNEDEPIRWWPGDGFTQGDHVPFGIQLRSTIRIRATFFSEALLYLGARSSMLNPSD